MARPIEFDRSSARDRALLLFWDRGYQATSLVDLLDAMNIGRSSFYAAFSDKRSLYIECLDTFAARTQEVLNEARIRMAPLDALQDFFERNFIGRRVARGKLGCMLVNTVLEMSGVDDELSARASRHLGDMESVFAACFRDAGLEEAGAREMAAVLMVINEGIRVASRRQIAPEEQLKGIRATFRLLRQSLQSTPCLARTGPLHHDRLFRPSRQDDYRRRFCDPGAHA
ncbi:MAG: TetR/AcrR family transcriptional regulator [Dechloromonas sp.]|nr:MAG: TetR/AcrR family transcriptional regulator [Dechloromonas sp.]